MKSHQSKKQSGFTLIEIAIVVVIIGLLLGGVLKGQEMIRNARAHNVAAQGAAIKAAVLGFSDRYRALPGDYKKATTNIPGLTATDNGDGNSRIGFDDSGTAGTPEAGNRKLEIVLAWKHLSKSGFISGAFDGDVNDVVEADWICSASCLSNAFNGSLFLVYDDEQTGTTWSAGTARSNQLWTGKGIPVEIIAELDRKVDDGEPSVGSFRVSDGFMDAAALDASDAPLMGDVCAAAATGAVPLPASSADPDGVCLDHHRPGNRLRRGISLLSNARLYPLFKKSPPLGGLFFHPSSGNSVQNSLQVARLYQKLTQMKDQDEIGMVKKSPILGDR